MVFDLASAETVLVPARLGHGGKLALFALARGSGIVVRPLETLDPTRPAAELRVFRMAVEGSTRIDRDGFTSGDFAVPLRIARLGLAAEQIGAAQGVFDLTLAYISGRVQFGRTIASFQAIKHRCAELVVELAEARSLLYGAASSVDAGAPETDLELDALGALACNVLWRAAEEAIQLHGGVGNTWEYDPHFYLRRAQASAHLFGSADARLGRIASHLLDGEAA